MRLLTIVYIQIAGLKNNLNGHKARKHHYLKKVEILEKQIEKMKADVRMNIKWADHEKNNQMWQKLIKMINEWS